VVVVNVDDDGITCDDDADDDADAAADFRWSMALRTEVAF
jgi:hypothetical protein